MINKKLLPLMGISALLLMVNLPQADADLCGDTVDLLILNDDTGATIFQGSGVVPWDVNNVPITQGVFIDFTVFCDNDGDGISTIFWDYNNPNDFIVLVPNHSFWFSDLEWTDAVTGEVTDFVVSDFNHETPSLMTTGFTPNSAHAIVGEFQINPLSDLINDLFLTAMHPVGGEFSPISTSALLLAGGQNMMAWMIPLVVAAAGFGLVIARKL